MRNPRFGGSSVRVITVALAGGWLLFGCADGESVAPHVSGNSVESSPPESLSRAIPVLGRPHGDVAPSGEGGTNGLGGAAGVEAPQPLTARHTEPKQLTAGVWDDSFNINLFDTYLQETAYVDAPRFPWPLHAERARIPLKKHRQLDVAFVINTGRTMTDEIAFLREQLHAIAERIASEYPRAEQRWSFVLYGGEGVRGDEEVVRSFDFQPDVDVFAKVLEDEQTSGFSQTADHPLAAASRLSFRKDAAHLAFWITDAPDDAARTAEIEESIKALIAADIHVYPVAAGMDEKMELTMRTTAQLTLGRYLFLTDLSPFAYAHIQPSVICYAVTHFSQTLFRMVQIEMNGTYEAAPHDQLLRRSGNPDANGVCHLPGGGQLQLF